MRGPISALNRT